MSGLSIDPIIGQRQCPAGTPGADQRVCSTRLVGAGYLLRLA